MLTPRSLDAGELLVPHDDEQQDADQTEQDQEGNGDATEHSAAETGPQGDVSRDRNDQASSDLYRHEQSIVSATEEGPHPESDFTGNDARVKDALPERSSRQASTKSSLNAVADTNFTQKQNGK